MIYRAFVSGEFAWPCHRVISIVFELGYDISPLIKFLDPCGLCPVLPVSQEYGQVRRRFLPGEYRKVTQDGLRRASTAGLDPNGSVILGPSEPILAAYERTRKAASLRLMEPLPSEDTNPTYGWPAGATFLAELYSDPIPEEYNCITEPKEYYDAATFGRLVDAVLEDHAERFPEAGAQRGMARSHMRWWIDREGKQDQIP